MSQHGKHGVVWLCAECSVPFASLYIRNRVPDHAQTGKLENRNFATDGLPPISAKLRRECMKLAEHAAEVMAENPRRSARISYSSVVPAVKLDIGLNPVGQTFQFMVANVSREDLGPVHREPIDSEFVPLKLP